MSATQDKLQLNGLNCDAVAEKPQDYDFSEKTFGEDWDIAFDVSRHECPACDGNEYVECSECGGSHQVTCDDCDGSGQQSCSDCSGSGKEECDSCEGNGVLYDEEGVECEDCGGTGEIDCSYCNGSGEIDCDECSGSGEVDCDECDSDGEVTCSECDGTGVVDGDADYDSWSPMMNYIYPLPGSFEVPDDVQDKLNNTTIVCIDDNYYLALTGGGMDLSWEICESYINLGYYPPAHFCCLPRMAGRGTSDGDKRILAYCRESLRIKQRWDANDLNSLESNFDIPEAEFSRPW
mgnify:CR=1 FL=1